MKRDGSKRTLVWVKRPLCRVRPAILVSSSQPEQGAGVRSWAILAARGQASEFGKDHCRWRQRGDKGSGVAEVSREFVRQMRGRERLNCKRRAGEREGRHADKGSPLFIRVTAACD